jgi:uncharacterized protein YlaN (UPF0358 family)
MINNYSQFINEKKFFSKIKKSKDKKTKIDRVGKTVDDILKYLESNGITNWTGFERMSLFKRDVINKLIDSQVKNMDELKEVIFKVRLELSDRLQLREYLSELERSEEYEKCSLILKKMNLK